MSTIILNDTNYSGYSADITFSAYTGGSTFLGTHIIPYTFTLDYYYGTYTLYYSQFNKTCTYVEPPILNDKLRLIFNSDGSLTSYLDVRGTSVFDIIINWGDGSPIDSTGYTGQTEYVLSHTYAVGTYTAELTFSDNDLVDYLYVNNFLSSTQNVNILNNLHSLILVGNLITNVNNIMPLPNSLESLNLSYNQLTTFNPTLPLPSSLLSLQLTNNQLTTFNPTLPLPSTLLSLFLNYNQLTTFNPTLPLPNSLYFLTLDYNQLTTFSPTLPLPNNLNYLIISNNLLTSFSATLPTLLQNINLDYNQLPSSVINNVLINLSGTSVTGGVASLHNQTPSACLSGDGILAWYQLINNRDWTVIIDSECFLTVTTNSAVNFNSSIYGNVPFNMYIDWGDGSPIEKYNNNGYYFPSHTFSSFSTIKILFSNKEAIVEIYMNNDLINNISGLGLLTNLLVINVESNQLTTLDVSENTSLTNLNCGSNLLTTLDVSNNTLLSTLYCLNNQLTTTSINNLLINLTGTSVTGGDFNSTSQTPLACISGEGVTAYNYLLSWLGWTVQVDCLLSNFTIKFNPNGINSTSWGIDVSNYNGILNMTVDWGDGQTSGYTGNYAYSPTHTYATAGTYDAIITIDKQYIYDLNLSNNFVSQVNLSGLSIGNVEVNTIFLQNNIIEDINISVLFLAYLDLSNNLLTSYNLNQLCPIDSLLLSNNQISSFICTGQTNGPGELYLGNNLLTTFDIVIPNNLYALSLNNNLLTQSSVNNLLINLSENTPQIYGSLNLSNQTPPACPSGDGILAQNYLVNDLGWTVNTGCPFLVDTTVDTINPLSANLGATIVSDGGTTSIVERGTVFSLSSPVTSTDNPLSEGGTGIGIFTQFRNLNPETHYYFAGYATNGYGTELSPESSFFTLSNPPVTQASNLNGTPFSSEEIDVGWIAADFPSYGASYKRYILLRATAPNIPVFTAVNGTAPTADANTTIVNQDISDLSSSAPAKGLDALTEYNFLLIPFCWNGINPETCNYLITNAPTANITTTNIPPAIIINPTVTNITNTNNLTGGTVSAILGATITSDPGGSGIADRGTVYNTSSPVIISNNTLSEGTGMGTFTQLRTDLLPQTYYYFAGYAITNDGAVSTSSESSFYTLSNPPINNASGLVSSNITTDGCQINWTSAVFPTLGANFPGYILIRADYPNVPSIINDNGQSPVAGPNTTIVYIIGDNFTYTITGLNSGTHYNLKLIPYTWNGVNPETYNYLVVGAPVVDFTTL